MSKTLVKVKHNGAATSKKGRLIFFKMGVAIELPEEVLAAIGENNYEVLETAKKEDDTDPKKPTYKELSAKAKELGINAVGKKYEDLLALIEEAEKTKKEGGNQ